MMTTLHHVMKRDQLDSPGHPLHEEQWQDNLADGKLQQPWATEGCAGDAHLTISVQLTSPSWELPRWIQKLNSDEVFGTAFW